MRLRALLAALVLLSAISRQGSAAELGPPLYLSRARQGITVFASADRQASILGRLRRGETIEILSVSPDWLTIRFLQGEGYIRRWNVDETAVVPVDRSLTPAYPAVVCAWVGWLKQEASVHVRPERSAEALITLRAGARLAFISIEDGWARLIHHRQYGFVDTSLLSELQPVAASAETASDASPIAAYTSFYRTTSDEANLNRIENLKTACAKLSAFTLESGQDFDFNRDIGPYTRMNGYLPAIVLVDGGPALGYGGGTCQVSSTLYNAVLQLPGIEILHRRAHGPVGAPYLPLGADAAVGSRTQNFIFRSHYPFAVRLDGTASDGALTIAVYRGALP